MWCSPSWHSSLQVAGRTACINFPSHGKLSTTRIFRAPIFLMGQVFCSSPTVLCVIFDGLNWHETASCLHLASLVLMGWRNCCYFQSTCPQVLSPLFWLSFPACWRRTMKSRSTSPPLHVHVDENTPVHVHIKKGQKTPPAKPQVWECSWAGYF